MNKVTLYIKETVDELQHNVTWPTWPELQSKALVIIAATILIAILIAVMDLVSSKSLGIIYESL